MFATQEREVINVSMEYLELCAVALPLNII